MQPLEGLPREDLVDAKFPCDIDSRVYQLICSGATAYPVSARPIEAEEGDDEDIVSYEDLEPPVLARVRRTKNQRRRDRRRHALQEEKAFHDLVDAYIDMNRVCHFYEVDDTYEGEMDISLRSNAVAEMWEIADLGPATKTDMYPDGKPIRAVAIVSAGKVLWSSLYQMSNTDPARRHTPMFAILDTPTGWSGPANVEIDPSDTKRLAFSHTHVSEDWVEANMGPNGHKIFTWRYAFVMSRFREAALTISGTPSERAHKRSELMDKFFKSKKLRHKKDESKEAHLGRVRHIFAKGYLEWLCNEWGADPSDTVTITSAPMVAITVLRDTLIYVPYTRRAYMHYVARAIVGVRNHCEDFLKKVDVDTKARSKAISQHLAASISRVVRAELDEMTGPQQKAALLRRGYVARAVKAVDADIEKGRTREARKEHKRRGRDRRSGRDAKGDDYYVNGEAQGLLPTVTGATANVNFLGFEFIVPLMEDHVPKGNHALVYSILHAINATALGSWEAGAVSWLLVATQHVIKPEDTFSRCAEHVREYFHRGDNAVPEGLLDSTCEAVASCVGPILAVVGVPLEYLREKCHMSAILDSMKVLSTVGRGVTGVRAIISAVCDIVSAASIYIFGKDFLNPERDAIHQDLNSIHDTLYELQNVGTFTDAHFASYTDVLSRLQTYERMRDNKFFQGRLLRYLAAVRSLGPKAATYRQTAELRMEPIWLHLHGKAGVGKSRASNVFYEDLARVRGEQYQNSHLWPMPPNADSFDDGLTNDKMYAYCDDYMQSDDADDKLAAAEKMIRFVSTTPALGHMADLADKGVTYFKCHHVMTTSNRKTFGTVNIHSQPALYRRIAFSVELVDCGHADPRDQIWRLYRCQGPDHRLVSEGARFYERAHGSMGSYVDLDYASFLALYAAYYRAKLAAHEKGTSNYDVASLNARALNLISAYDSVPITDRTSPSQPVDDYSDGEAEGVFDGVRAHSANVATSAAAAATRVRGSIPTYGELSARGTEAGAQLRDSARRYCAKTTEAFGVLGERIGAIAGSIDVNKTATLAMCCGALAFLYKMYRVSAGFHEHLKEGMDSVLEANVKAVDRFTSDIVGFINDGTLTNEQAGVLIRHFVGDVYSVGKPESTMKGHRRVKVEGRSIVQHNKHWKSIRESDDAKAQAGHLESKFVALAKKCVRVEFKTSGGINGITAIPISDRVCIMPSHTFYFSRPTFQAYRIIHRNGHVGPWHPSLDDFITVEGPGDMVALQAPDSEQLFSSIYKDLEDEPADYEDGANIIYCHRTFKGADSIVMVASGSRVRSANAVRYTSGEYTFSIQPSDRIEYDIATESGWCGGLVCVMKHGQARVAGYHIARHGDNVGVAAKLSKKLADAILYSIGGEIVQPSEPSEGIAESEGTLHGMPIVATVPKEKYNRASRRSKLRPTLLNTTRAFGEVTQIPAEPNPVVVDGVEIDPYELNFAGLRGPQDVPINTKWFDAAMFELQRRYRDVKRGVRVLTLDESVSGVEDVYTVKPLELSTSPGYGWDYKDKRKCVDIDEDTGIATPTEELRRRTQYLIDEAKRGRRTFVVAKDCFKDETLPVDSVRGKHKVRVITTFPVEYTVALRMYVSHAFAAMVTVASTHPVAVGINPHSVDWSNIYWRFAKCLHEGVTIQGDYKRYDKSIKPEMFYAFCDFIDWFYGDAVGSENSRVRRVLLREILNTRHLALGGCAIYETHGSHPSGDPGTSQYNSIVNWFIMFSVAAEAHERQGYDFDAFSFDMTAYGDDNMVYCREPIDVGQFSDIVAEFFNMTYTSATKDGKAVSVTPDDFMYLSRVFRVEGGHISAPLPLDTVRNIMYWERSTAGPDNADSNWQSRVTNFAIELTPFGLETYEAHASVVRAHYSYRWFPSFDVANDIRRDAGRWVPACVFCDFPLLLRPANSSILGRILVRREGHIAIDYSGLVFNVVIEEVFRCAIYRALVWYFPHLAENEFTDFVAHYGVLMLQMYGEMALYASRRLAIGDWRADDTRYLLVQAATFVGIAMQARTLNVYLGVPVAVGLCAAHLFNNWSWGRAMVRSACNVARVGPTEAA